MEREDLRKLADVIFKRKEQKRDMKVTNQEQEFNKLFMWLMWAMQKSIERTFPPEWKLVRRFQLIEEKSKIKVVSFGIQDEFVSDLLLDNTEFRKVAAECVDFIGTLDHYEIYNRFPKDSHTTVDDFMIILKN